MVRVTTLVTSKYGRKYIPALLWFVVLMVSNPSSLFLRRRRLREFSSRPGAEWLCVPSYVFMTLPPLCSTCVVVVGDDEFVCMCGHPSLTNYVA